MSRLGLALACAICMVARLAADPPVAVHTLASDQLTLQVMDPTAADRYNRGVRFCPLAVVLAASLDNHDFLYHPAAHNVIDDHAGLPAEFDLCIPGGPATDLPPGYAEAKIGDGFLKIGVGVLAKQATPYNLFLHPVLLVPATTTATWSPDHASFRQTCPGVNGYAYALTADLRVEAATVTVAWSLTNTGTRPFVTRQYIHNFIRCDNHDVGPDYVLSFPYDYLAQGLEAGQRQRGRDLEFLARIPTWVNLLVPYPADYRGPNTCVLRQLASHQQITFTTSIPSIHTAIHARPAYIAPEQFIELHLAPSETLTWHRQTTFALLP